ncbi:hypothetical protein [Isoptericola variabilis]
MYRSTGSLLLPIAAHVVVNVVMLSVLA